VETIAPLPLRPCDDDGLTACFAFRFAATFPIFHTPQPRIAFRLLTMLTRQGYPARAER